MIVQVGSDRRYFCDVCGDECEGEPDFLVTMTYGTEDPCFGSSGEEYEVGVRLGDSETVWQYLAQPKYFACEECRCYSEGDHFLGDFETRARAVRVQLIEKMAKEKLLPEFAVDLEVLTERFEYWSKACDMLRETLKEGKLSDYGIESYAEQLVHALKKRAEFRYQSLRR